MHRFQVFRYRKKFSPEKLEKLGCLVECNSDNNIENIHEIKLLLRFKIEEFHE